ncbi:hypothetical protein [Acetobacter oeni]|uniref:Uncharacterized protein n=1 Tax=Acetobacter oeni TaxID=304077 RepID=A0A511XN31_9PROT|nr:hypothetical protein [Acetobacter oeni]MBB3881611.1 hypothetical protein [Acetobacter oeni]GBR04956.1 hypothetical protein AA21952_1583 [Acetobacter oeni LMG 21952]GEN64351.1 hypothetical protein AOE01nite_25750 [Acetobacter oeni]
MISTLSSGKSNEEANARDCVIFEVGSVAGARLALALARDAGVAPVLLSPPDAACFMGSPWWLALMAAVRDEEESVTGAPAFIDILDCGAQAGRAVAALGLGQARIILHPDCPQHRQAGVLAASLNAEMFSHRPEVYITAADLRAGRVSAALLLSSGRLSGDGSRGGLTERG